METHVHGSLSSLCAVLSAMLVSAPATVSSASQNRENAVYAMVDGKNLLLDLYQTAETDGPVPRVVWIHGGAWHLKFIST